MFKAVHLFSDGTFIAECEHFNSPLFQNTIIVLKSVSINQKSISQPVILSNKKRDLAEALRICSDSDIVIMYELDVVKALLSLKIPDNIIVAWRFFGAELYDRKISEYLTKESLFFLKEKSEKLKKIIKPRIVFGKISEMLRTFIKGNQYFTAAINRMDIFLGLSEYEYQHLVSTWNYLPDFIQLPVKYKAISFDPGIKKDIIIIGNSRSIYNNHLDILDTIDLADIRTDFEYKIPFSYGNENQYTSEIRRRVACSKKRISLIENFMTYESYINLLSSAKAAVFNSFRQMAMGNISNCINSGVKVYLNKNNVIYRWLKDLGIKIYSFDEFRTDLSFDNLQLHPDDVAYNIRTYNSISGKYNQNDFLSKIILRISERTIDVKVHKNNR